MGFSHNKNTFSKECETCKTPFMARPSRIKKGYDRFCSLACSIKARKSPIPLHERVMKSINVLGEKECWEWTSKTNVQGYGRINITNTGKKGLAHRVIYEINNGPIPPGKVILHTCDNPRCCNPAHLKLGTQLENVHDMYNKGRNSKSRRKRKLVT